MSKKGMKLTGILQTHNQHPQSDIKYEPLRTNIRNSKQKPIQSQITTVSHVSRKLQSLSPHQADLIKNTAYIPVNCGLRVTSNEEKQHQALQRQYVAIDMYEKEGSKPISPNTFERLAKNKKYEVVYEYHCPHSQGQIQEYYSSDSMTQSKRVIGERENYQLSDNGAVKNGVSSTSQQSGHQKIIRNTISPSNQVIRNNLSPLGQTVQTKVTTQKIYGPVEGRPIEGAFSVNNVNHKKTGSTIKGQSVIEYEVRSKIKSPDSNIKGSTSAVKGQALAVKGSISAVQAQATQIRQNRESLQSERRTEMVSGSKGKDTDKAQTIYGPREGQPIGGSRVSMAQNRDLDGSTIKDRNSFYEYNTQGGTHSIQRTTLYQQEYRKSIQNRGSVGRISMSPIKLTTQTQQIQSARDDGSVNNTMNIISKDQQSRESNLKDVVSNKSVARNISTQQNRKSSLSKQTIYGPSQGRPIGEAVYRQSSISGHEGQESSLISSKVIVYDQTTSNANQTVQKNTSPSTRTIQQTTFQIQQLRLRPSNSIYERTNNQKDQGQRVVEYQAHQAEYRTQSNNISIQPIKVTTKTQTKQSQVRNGSSGINDTANIEQIRNHRATSPTIQRNTSSTQVNVNGGSISRQIIYGPISGQPINAANHYHGPLEAVDSTIVSSSRHITNYGPLPTVNQAIRTNTSPSKKILRQGTSPNRGQYQQTNFYTREQYRTGGSNQLIANNDNGYLSGPAYFETQGRGKYNLIGRNSTNQNETVTKKQIQSAGTVGNIEIGGRSKVNIRQAYEDFESNIGINSKHNLKNMNSTREYSRKEISKEDMIEGQETEIKGHYRIQRDSGDMQESKHREYVQNVESRIIIGGGQMRSQEELNLKGKKKEQALREQSQHQSKAQRQEEQYTGIEPQFMDSRQSQPPLNLNMSSRPVVNPSAYSSPQLEERRKKLSEYQQTGTQGYNFKRGSEEPESKRKKQEYKYNLYSMLDEQFNMKCATGICMPNEICASTPKRQAWK